MGPDQAGIHSHYESTADYACAEPGGQDHREGRIQQRKDYFREVGSTAGVGQAGFLPAGTGESPKRADHHDQAV